MPCTVQTQDVDCRFIWRPERLLNDGGGGVYSNQVYLLCGSLGTSESVLLRWNSSKKLFESDFVVVRPGRHAGRLVGGREKSGYFDIALQSFWVAPYAFEVALIALDQADLSSLPNNFSEFSETPGYYDNRSQKSLCSSRSSFSTDTNATPTSCSSRCNFEDSRGRYFATKSTFCGSSNNNPEDSMGIRDVNDVYLVSASHSCFRTDELSQIGRAYKELEEFCLSSDLIASQVLYPNSCKSECMGEDCLVGQPGWEAEHNGRLTKKKFAEIDSGISSAQSGFSFVRSQYDSNSTYCARSPVPNLIARPFSRFHPTSAPVSPSHTSIAQLVDALQRHSRHIYRIATSSQSISAIRQQQRTCPKVVTKVPIMLEQSARVNDELLSLQKDLIAKARLREETTILSAKVHQLKENIAWVKNMGAVMTADDDLVEM